MIAVRFQTLLPSNHGFLMRFLRSLLLGLVLLSGFAAPALAVLAVDSSNPSFERLVQAELEKIRSGNRGLVTLQLLNRLEAAPATTTIRLLGADEATWHPNDRRGSRSHVVAADTRLRGAERTRPTDAVLYLHPSRIDPSLSLFKLGTFVHEISFAADLNEGRFSADFRLRERRASFYRNGWLDSLGLKPVLISDRVPTPEYSQAKKKGLLTEENTDGFPLLEMPEPISPPEPPTP